MVAPPPPKDGRDGQDGKDGSLRALDLHGTLRKMGEMNKMGGMVLDGHGLDFTIEPRSSRFVCPF